MEKLLLTVAEAQETLSLGRTKVYELLAAGRVPCVRLGRSIRIPMAALKQWIEDQQNGNSVDSSSAR